MNEEQIRSELMEWFPEGSEDPRFTFDSIAEDCGVCDLCEFQWDRAPRSEDRGSVKIESTYICAHCLALHPKMNFPLFGIYATGNTQEDAGDDIH